jgi:hypothetical protein
MVARWPVIFSVGGLFETNNLSPASWGAQAEITSISSGLWTQAGFLIDYKAQPGAIASIGWSLFGIEFQYRSFQNVLPDPKSNDGYGPVLLGKVRIPIGFIIYALTRK